MPSDFVMQICHVPTGQLVSWAPGREIESNIIDELVDRVKAKGVGLLRTEAHVADDVRAAITELLHDLKAQV